MQGLGLEIKQIKFIMESSTAEGRKGSLDSGVSRSLSYGKDLWDSLSLLSDNTHQRTQQMKSLRTFFAAFKRALDTFAGSLAQANA
jgi:hypothetical protein